MVESLEPAPWLVRQDAQAMRGQRLHKLRDWLPLFIPLLIGSLERAMQIAEAMTARGYSVQPIKKQFPLQKIILPALLLFIVSGWLVILILNKIIFGWLLIGSGVVLLFILFFTSGRRFPKTRFHEETWKIPSIFLSAHLPESSRFSFWYLFREKKHWPIILIHRSLRQLFPFQFYWQFFYY